MHKELKNLKYAIDEFYEDRKQERMKFSYLELAIEKVLTPEDSQKVFEEYSNLRNPYKQYIGEVVEIRNKSGQIFKIKVTECGLAYIKGYDIERLNLHVPLTTIENIELGEF